MNEQPLDLRRFIRALARSKWVVLVCVALGVAAAGVWSVAHPPMYSAHALVLLQASSLDANGQPTRNIRTEIQIASSDDVLAIAAKHLQPVPRVSELDQRVSVAGPTSDILQFTGRAKSARQAIAIANATAAGYREYASKGESDLFDQLLATLSDQVDQLNKQVTGLQNQIDAARLALLTMPSNSAQASVQAGSIASLRTQQNAAVTRVSNLRSEITQARLQTDVKTAGTKVLEQASTASNATVRTTAVSVLIGAIVGLLVAILIALARDGRDRRLRRRDDIALAAGAPAVATIATQRPRTADEWLALLQRYEATVDETWSLRRVLRGLVAVDGSTSAGATNVTIVTLAGDDGAVAIAPQFAAFAANAGVRTKLVVTSRDPSVASLNQACRTASVVGELARANLWTDGEASEREDPDSAQLIVTIEVTDDGTLDLAPDHPATTLLGISAGVAPAERISAVAAAAAEANHSLAGVIVANPEPENSAAAHAAVRHLGNGPHASQATHAREDSAS